MRSSTCPRRRRLLLLVAVALLPAVGQEPQPLAPAEVVVTDRVLRPAALVPPLGANQWGRCGAVEWAANNFVRNAGNEPIHWRNLHRVKACGPDWFEIDGPGTSWWDLWNSGFLSGAGVRIYRLVDRAGQPLPARGDYLDIAAADHVALVGRATILPEGSPGYPDGGWVANTSTTPYPNAWIRHGNRAVTDAAALENGREYWYQVVAVGPDNQDSEPSAEVSATPRAGAATPPHQVIGGNDDKLPNLASGRGFDFTPRVFGGAPPYRWELLDQNGQPGPFPASLNLTLDPATGRISGTPRADAADLRFELRVTDSQGRSDRRWYTFNLPTAVAAKGAKPSPPTNVRAVAGDGCVTVTWDASPTPGVVAYRLRRSTAPAAQQEQRVHLAPGGPALEKWDYVVLEKRFDRFDMKLVNPRVRGIGNPVDSPNWHWRSEGNRAAFALVPHPQPVPADLIDPGETCLQVTAPAGEQQISQTVFIGTAHDYESIWYGQLEPGKRYRLEAWLRREGLAKDGEVAFSYGRGYPELRQTFQVSGEWAKYTWDFTGPERPRDPWHFGHTLTVTGPGKLFLDNVRIFGVERPEALIRPYVPNTTVLRELLASQPTAGRKGAHRIWFLTRDATMDSILSWHANSSVSPDWATSVGGTMDMTLPMALLFDLETGPDPDSRMRPFLVLQHLLHSEQDWLNLVEYLGAPYDPQRDTPAAKPYAHRRYQQRGTGTPWTAEFAEILLEFGNETWHNGHFADWLGFGRYNAIWQGGPEYGFFAQYLIDTMKRSPYWQAEGLDRKIRFCLGAGYNGSVEPDGKVRGYGEEAMQTSRDPAYLGHANYVGPKWETGDQASGQFDDHGVQGTLLGFVAGPAENQRKMAAAGEALAQRQRPYDLVAYEGGPSGYALPGRDSAQQKLVNEQYGKSLAMGVAALDAWLGSYRLGWTWQAFLGYNQGLYWSSHTPLWDGFRPSPGWQALALRNLVSGDLMAVEEQQVPTIAWDKKTYPLVGVYALRDGRRWGIFVLSRKLDGRHDGVDFGDGTTPVTLRLPFQAAAKVTLHRLTGNPRESNRESLKIQPETIELPAAAVQAGRLSITTQTGGLAGGLPPGSIYLYVIEQAGG